MDEYDISVGLDPQVANLFSQMGNALGGGVQGGFGGGASAGMGGGAFYGMGSLGSEFANHASFAPGPQAGPGSSSGMSSLLILILVLVAIFLIMR